MMGDNNSTMSSARSSTEFLAPPPIQIQSPLRGKKRQVNDDDSGSDGEDGLNGSSNNNNNNGRTSPMMMSPNKGNLKRLKTTGVSLGSQIVSIESPHSGPQLDKILPSLEKDQLISILCTLASNYPHLRSHITSLLPRPTLTSVTSQLENLEKRLHESFPYSRYGSDGSDRSDYSFNRVRPILLEIKSTILHYINYFTSEHNYPLDLRHEFPVTAFTYLHYSTCLTHRFPVWSNEMHNMETRLELYQILGMKWTELVKAIGRQVSEESKVFSGSLVGEWAQNLLNHQREVKGMYGFTDAVDTFKNDLGWLIGLPGGLPRGLSFGQG